MIMIELSYRQMRLLEILSTGPASLGGISRMLKLSSSSASLLATSLVKLGFITRDRQDPNGLISDHRQSFLTITPEGLARYRSF